jgi:hypothetical protein
LQLKAYAKKAKDGLGSGFLVLLDQLDAAYQWRMSDDREVGGRVEPRRAYLLSKDQRIDKTGRNCQVSSEVRIFLIWNPNLIPTVTLIATQMRSFQQARQSRNG